MTARVIAFPRPALILTEEDRTAAEDEDRWVPSGGACIVAVLAGAAFGLGTVAVVGAFWLGVMYGGR